MVQNMIKGPFWMNPEVLANLLLLAIFTFWTQIERPSL